MKKCLVRLRFQVVKIKQVDYRVSTKNVNNYKYKTFCGIFGQLQKEYIRTNNQIMGLPLNGEKTDINELIVKMKADLEKRTW